MTATSRVHRPRIAIVVQRYGAEIIGGAEAHARAIAQKLVERYDVDVLTTCAKDNRHWSMDYPSGESSDGSIRVLRFPQNPRGSVWRRRTDWKVARLAKKAQRGEVSPPFVSASDSLSKRELDWLAAQGPESKALIEHLDRHRSQYAAVIVYSLRYWTAVHATLVAAEKSILIPTLHDEKAMYRSVFGHTLARASTVLFNAKAEQKLADSLYGRRYLRNELIGLGIDAPTVDPNVQANAREKYGVDAPYVIYTGRVNAAKGCDQLFSAFEKFRSITASPVKLVVVGRVEMPLPKADWLVSTGFVDDLTRDALLVGAFALVLPSKYESLSLSTLEAMACGVPVIVNGECAVLEDHVLLSGTGYAFRGRDELVSAIARMHGLSETERGEIADKSKRYVSENYTWPVILEKIERSIAAIDPRHSQ
jgi:glycosyltransferase involved in cell wall biosynthesis